MTVQQFTEKLEFEQLSLEELKSYEYAKEIDEEVEAYRTTVVAKYAAKKQEEISTKEARIALLTELKAEAEAEEAEKIEITEKLANDAASSMRISTEVKPGV